MKPLNWFSWKCTFWHSLRRWFYWIYRQSHESSSCDGGYPKSIDDRFTMIESYALKNIICKFHSDVLFMILLIKLWVLKLGKMWMEIGPKKYIYLFHFYVKIINAQNWTQGMLTFEKTFRCMRIASIYIYGFIFLYVLIALLFSKSRRQAHSNSSQWVWKL